MPDPAAAPSRRRGHVGLALASLAVGGFAIGTSEFVTMGLLPEVASDLTVSIPSAGRIISAYALGVVVGAPLLAVLTARVGRIRLLLALMGAFAVGNVASALAPSYLPLVVARFVSGLPHGAYFGMASVVAASLVDPARRGRAVAMPMLGLTIANVVGVPFSSFLGQHLGWRSAYVFAAGVASLTVLLVWRQVPHVGAADGASPRTEVSALARPQVWLTVLTGAIGFGGMFAVYSYVAPILTHTSGWSPSFVPVALAVFGVGMTAGTALGGRLGDWSVARALLIGLAAQLATLAVFPLVAPSRAGVLVALVVLGVVSSLTATALQLRLMDVAGGDAAALGASLNHSALNLANASGAFVGGLVIEAGYGWTAPATVGAVMAAVGLALALTSLTTRHRAQTMLEPEST